MSREPNSTWALKHPGLSFPQRCVLGILGDFANGITMECWPSVSTVAKILQASPRTVQAAIRELEAKGLLRVQARRWEPNHYWVLRPNDKGAKPTSGAGGHPRSKQHRPQQQKHPAADAPPQQTADTPADDDIDPRSRQHFTPAAAAAESLKRESLKESPKESPSTPLRGSAATGATESPPAAGGGPAVKRKRPSRAKPRAPATPSTPMAGVGEDPPPTATASTSDAGPSPAAERALTPQAKALEIWNAVATRSRLVVATGTSVVFVRLAAAMKHPAIAGDFAAWQAHCCWLADHDFWGKAERELNVSKAAQFDMIDRWANTRRRVEQPYETEPSPIVPPWEMPEYTRQAKPAQPAAPPREAQHDASYGLDDATINEMWRKEEHERAGPGAAGPS